MGEYAHAQGNSLGNFGEFWDVVRRYPSVQGGFVWDWAEQDIRRPLITTPDSSGRDVTATLSGRPEVVAGRSGNALYFSGLDDTVEIYRDPALDLTGTGLTLDAVVLSGRAADERFHDPQQGRPVRAASHGSGHGSSSPSAAVVRSASSAPPSHRAGRARGIASPARTTARPCGCTSTAAKRPRPRGPDPSTTRVTTSLSAATPRRWASSTVAAPGTAPSTTSACTEVALDPGTIDADPAIGALLALDFDEFDTQGTYLSYGLYESGTDGLVTADRVAQPETAELAWVLAPIRITDADARAGRVTVTSERLFTDTSDLMLRWRVTEGATVVADGTAGDRRRTGRDDRRAAPGPSAQPGWLRAVPHRRSGDHP